MVLVELAAGLAALRLGPGAGLAATGATAGSRRLNGRTPPRTFTQEELDRIVSDRLGRERKKLTDLFGEDPEKVAQALKEQKDKEKSETDKLREQATQAEAKAKAAEERAKTALIEAAFVVAAKEANIVDPEDALKLADLGQVQVDDQGTVKGVKEAIEALTKAKPYLVKQGSGQVGSPSTPAGGGGNNPTLGGYPRGE